MPLRVAGVDIAPGDSRTVTLDVARLYDRTEVRVPLRILRGRSDGPVLFVSAAIHGDEINGVEIVRRLLRRVRRRPLRGTLVVVPIVNAFGFNSRSRYLPDRRDLNRCFPGSETGSLGARLAHMFLTEVVEPCTHGIDIHTGALHRTNLPQVRACLDDPETRRIAEAFGAPVILNASLRDGSLRQAARDRGKAVLVYEGGEALRFDEMAVRGGLAGILRVMASLGMVDTPRERAASSRSSYVALSSRWIRAPHSGILRVRKGLGAAVEEGDLLGIIADPFGEEGVEVRSTLQGVIIGQTRLPLVTRGDALFHVATFRDLKSVAESVTDWDELWEDAPAWRE